jgi:hypothetical protein
MAREQRLGRLVEQRRIRCDHDHMRALDLRFDGEPQRNTAHAPAAAGHAQRRLIAVLGERVGIGVVDGQLGVERDNVLGLGPSRSSRRGATVVTEPVISGRDPA